VRFLNLSQQFLMHFSMLKLGRQIVPQQQRHQIQTMPMQPNLWLMMPH
jgi:hypothetical protein